MPVQGQKTIQFAAALVIAVSQFSAAASAATEIFGGGYMTGNAACERNGWIGTQQVLARYAPQGAPGNPHSESQMALLLSTGTIAFRWNNLENYRTTQVLTQATYVWNGPWTPAAPTMNFSWHLYGDMPRATSAVLDELGLIFNNFNEHAGCTMTVFLSMRRNG